MPTVRLDLSLVIEILSAILFCSPIGAAAKHLNKPLTPQSRSHRLTLKSLSLLPADDWAISFLNDSREEELRDRKLCSASPF